MDELKKLVFELVDREMKVLYATPGFFDPVALAISERTPRSQAIKDHLRPFITAFTVKHAAALGAFSATTKH